MKKREKVKLSLKLCLLTSISGSNFLQLFDCKDKYWCKRLAESRLLELTNWNKGKRDLSHIGSPAKVDNNRAIPPQNLVPNEKRIQWIAVLLTHMKVSRVTLKYYIVTVT